MNIEENNHPKLPVKARIGRGKSVSKGNQVRNNSYIMNIEKGNHPKLPVKARIGRRKSAARGKSVSKGNQVRKKSNTVKRERGKVNIQVRNLVARGGKILRVKRNVPLNSTEHLSTPIERRLSQPKITRKIQPKRPQNNAFPSRRKVEFDEGVSEREVDQDQYMGNVNHSIENTSNFYKVPLLPTPRIEERSFPLYNDDIMDMKMNNLNELRLSRRNGLISNHNNFERFSKAPLLPRPPIEKRIFPIHDNMEMRVNNFRESGLFGENEMFSNLNRNYDVYTESNYRIPPVNEEAQYNHRIGYQSPDNFSIHQDSLVSHSYYDNMYNQGNISRNFSENSGRHCLYNNQAARERGYYSSSSEENKFGFVEYPFMSRRRPIYEGSIRSGRNSRNNQNFVELSSQGEMSADSFYTYKSHNEGSDNTFNRRRRYESGLIDILNGGSDMMDPFPEISSSSFGLNQVTSNKNTRVFRDEASDNQLKSERGSSYVYSATSKNSSEQTDMESNSTEVLKKLMNKKENIQLEMKFLLRKQVNAQLNSRPFPSSKVLMIEVLKKRIEEVNQQISALSGR